MGLLMGCALSFMMSIIGTLSSGRFSFISFLTSFIVSFLISQVITNILPIRKITESAVKKAGLRPGTMKHRLLETLVSDLLLTPFMTLVMVYIAYRQAVSQGARIPFGPMLLRSELISIVCAYVLIFALTPLFMKMLLRKVPER